MKYRALFLSAMLLFLLGICPLFAQQVTMHTLSSGKQIKILAEGRIDFKQGPPALMLKYESILNFENVAALRQEAEEIWNDYKEVAERKGFTVVILSANQPAKAGFSITKMYNFVFRKDEKGTWYLENQQSQTR